jgi:hypothetical protein
MINEWHLRYYVTTKNDNALIKKKIVDYIYLHSYSPGKNGLFHFWFKVTFGPT